MGFLLVPKDVTSRGNSLNLKPIFFCGSLDLLQADPEEDELRLGYDWMDVPVIPFNIVEVHMVHF